MTLKGDIMSLIKFLLFRNKKTSVLGARKYGKTESVEPKETSALAYRQYGKHVSKNKNTRNEEQLLKK